MKLKDSNGTCGWAVKCAVTAVVIGSIVAQPPSWRGRRGYSTEMKFTSGGTGRGVPKYTLPVSVWPGNSGVTNSTRPISDDAGHCGGASTPKPNCSAVHGSRPLASGGVSARPAGRLRADVGRGGGGGA